MRSSERLSARDRLAHFNINSQSGQRRFWIRIGVMGAVLLLSIWGLFFLEVEQTATTVRSIPDAMCRSLSVGNDTTFASFLDEDLVWSMDGETGGGKSDLLVAVRFWMKGREPFVGNTLATDEEMDEKTIRFLCGTISGDHQNPTVHPVIKTVLVDLTMRKSGNQWLATEVAVRSTF